MKRQSQKKLWMKNPSKNLQKLKINHQEKRKLNQEADQGQKSTRQRRRQKPRRKLIKADMTI